MSNLSGKSAKAYRIERDEARTALKRSGPLFLSLIEAKMLLAMLDTTVNTVDGSDEIEEFDWLTTRSAGKVFVNHMRNVLEDFIAKREGFINASNPEDER